MSMSAPSIGRGNLVLMGFIDRPCPSKWRVDFHRKASTFNQLPTDQLSQERTTHAPVRVNSRCRERRCSIRLRRSDGGASMTPCTAESRSMRMLSGSWWMG